LRPVSAGGLYPKNLALIHVHGGGGNRGSKAGARLASTLASRGFVDVAMQYRLADEALWPAQLHDLKACVRWTRANATRLQVRIDQVAVLGYSIGGQFALIASGTPNRVDLEEESGSPGMGTELSACIALYPSGLDDSGTKTVTGPEASADERQRLDPLAYVKEGFPPTLLLHGTADSVVPVDRSLALFQALRNAGASVELHVIERVNHSFEDNTEFAGPAADFIDLFLDRHLVNPRSYRERRR